jgi:hypothetical protein
MSFRKSCVIATLGILVSASARSLAAEPIRPNQFRDLHTLIKPATGEEKWKQIPWLTSLWEARRRAAAEGKPILLWEMDGHPLGCT